MSSDIPNRPDHPDFWLITKAVQEQDTAITPEEFERTWARIADLYSAVYVANQRMMRTCAQDEVLSTLPPEAARTVETVLKSLWMDGFLAGARFRDLKSSEEQSPGSPENRT